MKRRKGNDLRRRILVWGSIGAAIALVAVLVWIELQLLGTVTAFERSLASAEASSSRGHDDELRPCRTEPPAARLVRFFGKMGATGEGEMPTAAAVWGGLQRAWGRQLGFSLLLVLPVALVLALGAFIFAALLQQAGRWGAHRLVRAVVETIDAIPYILWTVPSILIGLYVYRRELFGWQPPYWLYLGLVFLGFGSFLLVSFVRQYQQQFLAQEAVLDGERMTGIGELRLFLRFFYFQLARTTFPRQCLYGAVFIMLLDFSFTTVLPIHHPGKPTTVFAAGNAHYELMRQVRADAGCGRRFCYVETLDRLAGLTSDREILAASKELREHPGLALDGQRWALLCERVRASAEETSGEARTALAELSSALRLPAMEQEALFYRRLAAYYIQFNCCLIFGFFFTVFLFFDSRSMTDAD